ncbi:17386_t:CDS:2 [Acaulospora colombiana]|uniref:17386_t:CDS:1 n=1 Tax=Acaulospora colombiana TaxID=27376 RepID=A0ACA9KSC1_9GLOM|nr:17386_t:CDS:2 [Acaulospora colombiana]
MSESNNAAISSPRSTAVQPSSPAHSDASSSSTKKDAEASASTEATTPLSNNGSTNGKPSKNKMKAEEDEKKRQLDALERNYRLDNLAFNHRDEILEQDIVSLSDPTQLISCAILKVTLIGHQVTVELKNDLAITGVLTSVDQFLNIKLDNIRVVDDAKYPHMVPMAVKNCFIRGSVVRYVQLPASAVDTALLQDAARREAQQPTTGGAHSMPR